MNILLWSIAFIIGVPALLIWRGLAVTGGHADAAESLLWAELHGDGTT